MPDNTNNIFSDNLNTDTNNTSNTDLLRALNEQSKYLESINNLLVRIQRDNETNNRRSYSQSDARYNSDFDFFGDRKKSTTEKQQDAKDRKSGNKNKSKNSDDEASSLKDTLKKFNKAFDDFFDEFEKSFSKQIFGPLSLGDFFSNSMKELAKAMGDETGNAAKTFGDALGQSLTNAVRNQDSKFGKTVGSLFDALGDAKTGLEERVYKSFTQNANNYQAKHGQTITEFPDAKDFIDYLTNHYGSTNAENNAENEFQNGQESTVESISHSIRDALKKTTSTNDVSNTTDFNIGVAYLDISKIEDTTKTFMPGQGQNSQFNKNTWDGSGGAAQKIAEQNKYAWDGSGGAAEAGTNAITDEGAKVLGDALGDEVTDALGDVSGAIGGVKNLASGVSDLLGGVKNGNTGQVVEGGVQTAEGLATFMSMDAALAGAVPVIGGVVVALVALQAAVNVVSDALKPVGENISKLFEDLSSAMDRDYESRDKQTKNAIDRLQSDVKTIIEEPFNILKDAADEVYQVWDAQLRTINGTQGYTKSDLQDLMSAYSARLQEEGLTNVVSSAEITEELAKVLNAGLSGQAAEEFAYIATVLNAAVPTQDFFDYVDTYTSIAGNMIAQGYSESEALQYANEQLEIFASNTLYASRQLAGGFTTGLTNAADLFQQSAQIAQTAGSNNVAEISSVLTAVSAITGSIAPDLANSMTDVIVQAATGGNSSELIALRSLAGTGASNTDFLNALVNDPQSVFVQLFNNLANLINTSDDAYMEVAGSLSEIFGISADALRRIDFNYLAQAISEMNVSNASLDENLALLASGETTTSKEEERIAQINQYMIDEGLAYVLDDAAARTIQEHMWNEQIANDIMEAEYGVELVGDSAALGNSMLNALGRISNLLFPLKGLVHGASNIFQTVTEGFGVSADIEDILEEGKVGEGNAKDLNNLVATGNAATLNLTDDLLTIMQNTTSSYAAYNGLANSSNLAKSEIASSSSSGSGAYSWGTVSKSTSNAITSLSGGVATGNTVEMPTTNQIVSEETTESLSRLERNFERFIDEEYVRGIVEEGGSYEDWVKTSRNFGIADFSAALEELGYTEMQAQDYFAEIQSEVGQEYYADYYERQQQFWDNMEGYMDYFTEWLDEYRTFMEETIYQDALVDKIYQEALTDNIYQDALTDNIYQDALKDSIYTDALTNKIYQTALIDKVYQEALKDSIYQDALVDKVYKDALNDKIYETSFNKDDFYKKFKGYYSDWTDYYIKHTYYDAAYDYSNVSKVQSSEKNGSSDAIYALAEELTKNSVDLLQPEIQTNALLSQILLVVNAIMQQGNTASTTTSNGTTTMSLAETLSGLALGLYNTT